MNDKNKIVLARDGGPSTNFSLLSAIITLFRANLVVDAPAKPGQDDFSFACM